MKIISYNINGVRAAAKKGLFTWLEGVDADVVCLQEIKAMPEQIAEITTLVESMGYNQYWHPAQKKGYSGVAILCKTKPDDVVYGCGSEWIDHEGRVLRADFGDLSVISVYMPSGSSGDERQVKKYEFLEYFTAYINELSKTRPNLVISGDYNICHKEIDIHNPKSNARTSGFLPEERAWMDAFIELGFTDTFRHYNKEPHHYTWWSMRPGVRQRNLGWRIDYHMATNSLRDRIEHVRILPDAVHSDHCPVLLQLRAATSQKEAGHKETVIVT